MFSLCFGAEELEIITIIRRIYTYANNYSESITVYSITVYINHSESVCLYAEYIPLISCASHNHHPVFSTRFVMKFIFFLTSEWYQWFYCSSFCSENTMSSIELILFREQNELTNFFGDNYSKFQCISENTMS